jgi:FkbM family methyltransferase
MRADWGLIPGKIGRKFRLLRAILFHQKRITVRLKSGQRLRIRINDPLGREILRDESFESAIRDRMLREVLQGMVVLDVGANIGYYTVQFARISGPTGRVIAFEPNPVMVAELKSNIELNDLSNVQVEQVALFNCNGEANLHCPLPGREACGTLFPIQTFELKDLIKVKTRTLDDFLKEAGWRFVDFMKVDVEGAERSVFQGASETLRGERKPVIFFECAEVACRSLGYRVSDVLGDLAVYGYRFEQVDQGNWLAMPPTK